MYLHWPVLPVPYFGEPNCYYARLQPFHRYWPDSTIGTTIVLLHGPVLPVGGPVLPLKQERQANNMELNKEHHRKVVWVQYWFVQVRNMIPP